MLQQIFRSMFPKISYELFELCYSKFAPCQLYPNFLYTMAKYKLRRVCSTLKRNFLWPYYFRVFIMSGKNKYAFLICIHYYKYGNIQK